MINFLPVLLAIFLVDLIFNVNIFLLGEAPLGRGAAFLSASYGLLINGTFKAPLNMALIMSILIVLRPLPRTWMFILLFLVVNATVVFAVLLTKGDGDF